MQKYVPCTMIMNQQDDIYKPGDYIKAQVIRRDGKRHFEGYQLYYGEIVDISGNMVTVEADPEEGRGMDGVFDLEQVYKLYIVNRPEKHVDCWCSRP